MSLRRPSAARQRVEELMAGGEYGRAEQLLRRYVVQYPRDARLHLSFGVCLLVKDPSAAESHIARAVSLAPNDVSLLLLATQWVMSLDAEAGRTYASRAVELGPTSPDDLARLAYLRGRYADFDSDLEAAERFLKQAINGDPADPIYARELIDLLVRQDRCDEARQISDAALLSVFSRRELEKQRSALGFD